MKKAPSWQAMRGLMGQISYQWWWLLLVSLSV